MKELSHVNGHDGSVRSVAVSSSGEFVLSAGADEKVYLWNSQLSQKIRELKGQNHSMQFSADGNYILTVGHDVTRLWDRRSGKELKRSEAPTHVFPGSYSQISAVKSGYISPDGTTVTLAMRDQSFLTWNIASGRELRTPLSETLLGEGEVLLANGRALTHNFIDGTFKFLDVQSGRKLLQFPGEKNRLLIALSHDA